MKFSEQKQLALDIVDGKVFGTWSISQEDYALLPVIFLPLAFMELSKIKKDVVHIYEYVDKAGLRGVNGYPTFMSCRLLKKSDAEALVPIIEQLKQQRKDFLE